MRWRRNLVLLVFAGSCGAGIAQNLVGVNPPGMKWSQFDAPTGRIIFPQGLDSLAFRTAAIMGAPTPVNTPRSPLSAIILSVITPVGCG